MVGSWSSPLDPGSTPDADTTILKMSYTSKDSYEVSNCQNTPTEYSRKAMKVRFALNPNANRHTAIVYLNVGRKLYMGVKKW